MLRLWRDEVRIALCPDRAVLARVARRWRPQVVAKHIVHCSGEATADWKPCVEALQTALQDPLLRDADATVVISNHFVRYALVPWSEHLVSDDEKRAWVMHHFVKSYGEPAAPMEYRWSEEGPDAACVASAIDGELIGQIRAACESASLRLRSVQPYLMAVFNRWKRRVAGNPAWIVVPEAGRVCIAAIANGQWRAITSRKIGPDFQAELPLALGRELLLADDVTAPAAVFAYAPEIAELDFPERPDVALKLLAPRALPGFSPRADAAYAIALTGVA